MIDRIPPTPPGPADAPRPANRSGAVFSLSAATPPAGVPASPPTEVLYALDRAQSVLAELASRQVSMHVSVDEETSKIHVELRDGEGRLIREVPAAHATAMLSGERPVGWLG
jgi:hypothetical protein